MLDVEKLKILFSRKSYNKFAYEWRINYISNNKEFSLPIIMYVLKENWWVKEKKELENIAECIKVLIEDGKIDYNDIVPETGHNIVDYLNKFEYNYPDSPIMRVLEKYNLVEASNSTSKIHDIYIFDTTHPYYQFYVDYAYTKDPSKKEEIIEKAN